MGFATDLHCDACGYGVEHMVLGFDVGGSGCVQAVSCADCRELRVATLPPDPPVLSHGVRTAETRVDFTRIPIHCPVSDEHRITPWYHPGPCPRCGAELRAGQRAIIWD